MKGLYFESAYRRVVKHKICRAYRPDRISQRVDPASRRLFVAEISEPIPGPNQVPSPLLNSISGRVGDVVAHTILPGLLGPQAHPTVSGISPQGVQDCPSGLVIREGAQFLGTIEHPTLDAGWIFPALNAAEGLHFLPSHRGIAPISKVHCFRFMGRRRGKIFGNSSLNLRPAGKGHVALPKTGALPNIIASGGSRVAP